MTARRATTPPAAPETDIACVVIAVSAAITPFVLPWEDPDPPRKRRSASAATAEDVPAAAPEVASLAAATEAAELVEAACAMSAPRRVRALVPALVDVAPAPVRGVARVRDPIAEEPEPAAPPSVLVETIAPVATLVEAPEPASDSRAVRSPGPAEVDAAAPAKLEERVTVPEVEEVLAAVPAIGDPSPTRAPAVLRVAPAAASE